MEVEEREEGMNDDEGAKRKREKGEAIVAGLGEIRSIRRGGAWWLVPIGLGFWEGRK